jgi:hypothetical protein
VFGACTADALYLQNQTSSVAVGATITLWHKVGAGAAAATTLTSTVAATTGLSATDNTHTVALAVGDMIAFQFSSPTGNWSTAGASGGGINYFAILHCQ